MTEVNVAAEVALTVPPRRFRLSDAEWLAVLPAAPAWAPDLPAAAAPTDPAAAARQACPLDGDAFLGTLRSGAPAMAASLRLQVLVEPFGSRALLRSAAACLSFVGIAAVFCVFGAAYYGTAQLAIGVAAFLVQVFACSLGLAAFAAYRSNFRAAGASGGSKSSPMEADFSGHGAAGLARWLQLVSASGTSSEPTEGALLQHDSSDALCPCSAPSCAGRLPWLAGVARFAESSFKFTVLLLYLLLALAGVAVFPPFSAQIWLAPWATIFMAFFCILGALFGVPLAFGRFATNLPLLELSRRVSRRAMRLALNPVIERYRAAVDSGSPWQGSAKPERAAYMDLHRLLSSTWRNRIRGFSTTSHLILPVSTAVICGLANMAVGSCLPAFYPGYFAYVLFAALLFDLVHVAAANSQVTDVRSLYLDAAQELADLRRELASTALPPDPSLVTAMEADSAVLASYLDADRYRARFLGFVVTFGTVRTLLVTALTLALGLWSVLRNLGVVLTGELACPPRA